MLFRRLAHLSGADNPVEEAFFFQFGKEDPLRLELREKLLTSLSEEEIRDRNRRVREVLVKKLSPEKFAEWEAFNRPFSEARIELARLRETLSEDQRTPHSHAP